MKLRTSFLFFVLFSFFATAQIPPGYYNAAAGKSGATLKTALYNIILGHTAVSYDNLWTAFQTTDKRSNGKVWDMYSNCTFTFVTNQCGTFSSECDCYNREHSLPKSWFNSSTPMYTDLFQLVPTDGTVNGARGNYPYGTVTNPTYTSGSGCKTGPCSYPGYTGTVFEPIGEYKGDFARNYFYMATRYENVISTWHSNDANAEAVLQPNSFPVFEVWFLNMLGEWHRDDPVSQKEIDRNNAVYAIQGNRNPFIDHPEYVYEVWGVGAPAFLPEPTNSATSFSAHNIHLEWTDATGTIVPAGYLVRMSDIGFSSISNPIDGTTYPNSANDQNVLFGVQNVWFNNLNVNTTYYFKLFGFTGSGTTIDYKTDGNVPQSQQTTGL